MRAVRTNVKIVRSPKVTYTFNTTPIKTPATFLTNIKKYTKCTWNQKKPAVSRAVLSPKGSAETSTG